MALDLDAGQWLILVFIFGLTVLGFVHHGEQTRLAHQRQRTPVRRARTPIRIDPRCAVKGNYSTTVDDDDISSESGPAGRRGIVEADPPTPTPAPKRRIAEQVDIKPSPDTAAQAGASKPHSSLAAQPQSSQTPMPANSVTQLFSLPVKTKPFPRSAARAVSNNDTASGSGSNNATASGAAFAPAPAPSSHASTEEKKSEWSPVILIDLKEVIGEKNEETGRHSIRLQPLRLGHFDHISDSMRLLARLNTELFEQAKNYNPPRTTIPFKSRNALPSDATPGVAEEIMSYDNGVARAEDQWVNKGYAKQMALSPGAPTPPLPLAAVDLATHKIVSRVDTRRVADNGKLNNRAKLVVPREPAPAGYRPYPRVHRGFSEEVSYTKSILACLKAIEAAEATNPPVPRPALDPKVSRILRFWYNNQLDRALGGKCPQAPPACVRRAMRELRRHVDSFNARMHGDSISARKRKRELDPEEASRHVKFRLESSESSATPKPRPPTRPEAVLANLPVAELSNEELLVLARYVPPGKLARKAVRSNKYYWNKYMQRVKAYWAAIKAISELGLELKLKPIEAFVTGEYLPLS
ncbi:hypothetical protein BKA62DRAFT_678167 [Auriculariales sp. MPI-PUGE-AT-0066]|nr:hypothetical protein BKA62DRAFT_678167 [Auriculariales sp. MPI-PUGE-AT-0066]